MCCAWRADGCGLVMQRVCTSPVHAGKVAITQACARLLQGLAQLLQAAPQRGVRALRTRVQAADGWRTASQSQGRRTRCGIAAAPAAVHAGLPCISRAVFDSRWRLRRGSREDSRGGDFRRRRQPADGAASTAPRFRPRDEAARDVLDKSVTRDDFGSTRDTGDRGQRGGTTNDWPADDAGRYVRGGNGERRGGGAAAGRFWPDDEATWAAWDRPVRDSYGSASPRDNGGRPSMRPPRGQLGGTANDRPAIGAGRDGRGGGAERRGGSAGAGAWARQSVAGPGPGSWQRGAGNGAAGRNGSGSGGAWQRGRDADQGGWERGREERAGSGRPMAGNGGGGAGRLFDALQGEALYGVNSVLGALEAGRRRVHVLYVQDGACPLSSLLRPKREED